MLNPIELQLLPSCFGALSWSPDGELAVAAGEHVQILTPKTGGLKPNTPGKDAWDITRIRVNTFTNAEWAPIPPQNRDDFSLGAEQSTSTAIGLAWSPAGLARFRRSVLAVLGSNLILSLWEPIGPRAIWTRVAIVNHALHPDPSAPSTLTGELLRKANIRSFHWCEPLKTPVPPEDSDQASEPESRWGVQLMSVTSDANEVVLLQIKRNANSTSSTRSYHIEKLTSYQLHGEKNTPKVCSGSILQKTLRLKSRILSISTGPWTPLHATKKNGVHSTSAMIAAVYGKQLYPLKTTITLRRSDNGTNTTAKYQVTAELADHSLADSSSKWAYCQIEGPIKWIHTNQSPKINLVVGTSTGFLTISMSRAFYQGTGKGKDRFEFWPTSTSSFPIEDGEPRSDWELIAGMATLTDEQNDACVLHLGTSAALGAAIDLETPISVEAESDNSLGLPQWSKVIKNVREQYDLDHDLQGYAMNRLWGLASYRGVVAVLVTRHPTNMIQYKVASDERAVVGFAFEGTEEAPDLESLFSPVSDHSEQFERSGREKSVTFLLSRCDKDDEINTEDQRLIYAAACCSIVNESLASTRPQAQKALERLAVKTGADLSEEISKCTNGASTISSKSPDQLSQVGGHLFEKCDICDAGIPWASVTEARCESGHLFVRCGLTSLAIQEPGVSKYCSTCQTEFLDEELIVRLRDEALSPVFMGVARAFDTCPYCNSKFKCSNIT
ncbi:unnamed protein product [Penicillium pancosmium]